MYRVILFLSVAAVVSAGDIDKKCMKLFHPNTMFCCKKPPLEPSNNLDLKECFGLPTKPLTTCERDACIAKKKGYIGANGKVDKEAVPGIIEKEFENQPEFVDLVKEKCVDGDLNMYGPENLCDTLKIKNCIQLQFVVQCPEFSDEGDCSGTTALVEECSKSFS